MRWAFHAFLPVTRGYFGGPFLFSIFVLFCFRVIMLGIYLYALQAYGVDLGHERRKTWQLHIFQDQYSPPMALRFQL
jgi:hypothetical protein